MFVGQNVGARSFDRYSQLLIDACLLLKINNKHLHASLTVEQLLVLLRQLLKKIPNDTRIAVVLLVDYHSIVVERRSRLARLFYQSLILVPPILGIRVLFVHYGFGLDHFGPLRKHQRTSTLFVGTSQRIKRTDHNCL